MSKQKILKGIRELIEKQEQAIQHHPEETAAVYLRHRDEFIKELGPAQEGVDPAELDAIRRYMLSSSFISAWYHLAHDKTNRDKAAHSCCTLVSHLGGDSSEVMQTYVGYELLWRDTMKAEGIVPRRVSLAALAVVLVIIVVLLILGARLL